MNGERNRLGESFLVHFVKTNSDVLWDLFTGPEAFKY